MINTIFYIIVVAMCAASISFTITTTSIFLWFRELISPIHHKIEELIHCPYCISHYIILVIMLLTSDIPYFHIFSYTILNFLFLWFVIVALVALLHNTILKAYKPVTDYMIYRKLQKLKAQDKANNI